MKLIEGLLSSVENGRFNLMIETELPTGNPRTVGHSFNVNPGTSIEELEELLIPFIETFEAQSGSGEEGGFCS